FSVRFVSAKRNVPSGHFSTQVFPLVFSKCPLLCRQYRRSPTPAWATQTNSSRQTTASPIERHLLMRYLQKRNQTSPPPAPRRFTNLQAALINLLLQHDQDDALAGRRLELARPIHAQHLGADRQGVLLQLVDAFQGRVLLAAGRDDDVDGSGRGRWIE